MDYGQYTDATSDNDEEYINIVSNNEEDYIHIIDLTEETKSQTVQFPMTYNKFTCFKKI